MTPKPAPLTYTVPLRRCSYKGRESRYWSGLGTQRVEGRGGNSEAHVERRCGVASGADLGCSSGYSTGRHFLQSRWGLEWRRFPCQQQSDMGESVL